MLHGEGEHAGRVVEVRLVAGEGEVGSEGGQQGDHHQLHHLVPHARPTTRRKRLNGQFSLVGRLLLVIELSF